MGAGDLTGGKRWLGGIRGPLFCGVRDGRTHGGRVFAPDGVEGLVGAGRGNLGGSSLWVSLVWGSRGGVGRGRSSGVQRGIRECRCVWG